MTATFWTADFLNNANITYVNRAINSAQKLKI